MIMIEKSAFTNCSKVFDIRVPYIALVDNPQCKGNKNIIVQQVLSSASMRTQRSVTIRQQSGN